MSETWRCGCGRDFISLEALTRHREHQECKEVVEYHQREQRDGDLFPGLPHWVDPAALAPQRDMVNHPSHYTAYPVEVIEMIKSVLGPNGFRAYCLGNEIKYRMRAGLKGDPAEDLAKAMKYKQFREGAEQNEKRR